VSEHDLRDGLRAAVEIEPPLEFDPDALIARGRHLRRRRHALMTVGALVVAGVVGTSVLLRPPAPGVETGTGGTVLTTTATPSSTTVPQSRVDRLTARLRVAFAALAPDVKIADVHFKEKPDPGLPGSVSGLVSYENDGTTGGALAVTVYEAGAFDREAYCSSEVCEQPLPSAASGTVVFASRQAGFARQVAHLRPDGSAVYVVWFGVQEPDGSPQSGAKVLDDKVLAALATDPALHP